MRALLTTATAALALGVLAGCGNATTPAASDQTTTTATTTTAPTTSEQPPTPSDVTTPEPPVGGKPQNPSGGGQPPVTIGANGPVVPKGVSEVPASQVDASALPNYFEFGNRVWQFEDGFSLQLFAAASSSCADAEAVVVDQSADTVKIIVRPLDQPQGGAPDDGVCTMVMTPKPVVVTLDQPLRDRKVLLSAGR
jgi:hypothetical protein